MDRKKAQKKDEEGVQKSMASWLPKDATVIALYGNEEFL